VRYVKVHRSWFIAGGRRAEVEVAVANFQGLVIKRLLVCTSYPGYNDLILFYQVSYPETVQFKCPVIPVIINLVFVRVMNLREL